MSSAVLYTPSIASSSASSLRQKMRVALLPVNPAIARPRSAPYTWIEPLAIISAPQATEPMIVTSPDSWTIDWPERIG